MTHPLHTQEFLDRFSDQADVGERRTGRSTAQGLELIAVAIAHPYLRVHIRDHFGSPMADHNLTHMMQVMVQRLELEHMHFGLLSDGKPYIVFGEIAQ